MAHYRQVRRVRCSGHYPNGAIAKKYSPLLYQLSYRGQKLLLISKCETTAPPTHCTTTKGVQEERYRTYYKWRNIGENPIEAERKTKKNASSKATHTHGFTIEE